MVDHPDPDGGGGAPPPPVPHPPAVVVGGCWPGGTADAATAQLLHEAHAVAAPLGVEVVGVEMADQAQAAPATARALAEVVEALRAPLLLVAAGVGTEDLVPRTAARLGAVAALDCRTVQVEDGALVLRRPVHGGAFDATLALAPGDRLVASLDVQARAAVTADPASTDAPVPVPIAVLVIDLETPTPTVREAPPSGSSPGDEPRCIGRAVTEEVTPLSRARRIVSGGRGLGGPEGFATLTRLAAALGAELGASRPPCDAGWVPARHQVGITGARVAPEWYLAVGISGSVQHLAGMRAAQRIVAVNRDASAPIFGYADLGVVGDWQEVVAGMLDVLDAPDGRDVAATTAVAAGAVAAGAGGHR